MSSLTSAPVKKVLILRDIQTDTQFHAMTQQIDAMYANQTPFWMLIETQHVRDIKPKYLYQFGKYLNSLKVITPQLLQYSQIHVYNDIIFNILYTLFIFIARPVAKVTVIYYDGGYTPTNIPIGQRNIKKIKEYFPR